MKHIHTFTSFINESIPLIEAQRHKPANHIENIEIKDKSNKKAEEDVQNYLDDNSEFCPRCGEHRDDCQCGSKDPWSTQNYHRIPKGNVE